MKVPESSREKGEKRSGTSQSPGRRVRARHAQKARARGRGRRTWSVSSGQGLAAGVLGELKNGPLSVRSRGDDGDVLRVLDGTDNPGGHLKLLPSLSEVKDVEPVLSPPVDVSLHLVVAVLGAEVARCRKHHLDVRFLLRDRHRV